MNPGIAGNSCVSGSEMCAEPSTLLSAHGLYVAITGHLPRPAAVPTILEQVRGNAAGHVDAEATGHLFNRLWKLASRFKGLDLELDMSRVGSVAPRFYRELAFLRRHLKRRVVLSNVCPELADLLQIGQSG